ncbi:ketopantoate reductase family protein [Microbacterium sp. SORGH_AS_0888]|uniref:ketopantoate reductase family protein n=1 Tax=Microbacterium sp. SORGH_AS_0888 TaxID=3041791 RepID=UPI002788A6BF|nr:2-dehydropantoate 2-reductase N-terminal domain-containing protein [Microbacterium sp. SORGH_AS_0888]MDQ1130533.1 2-dehydropantoate 2-reductase [Microbacterium sp. SORGH_AS_0888]
MTRRYVVIGAGGVGAALAAGLVEAGVPVLLVSRGRSFEAIAAHGIRFSHEGRTRVLDLPVADSAVDIPLAPDDVLVLAVKTQDVAAAVPGWAARPVGDGALAGETLPIVTLQNGLEAERVALRHFASVVGGTTLVAAQHLVPGEVTVRGGPELGRIILGAFPSAERAPRAAAEVAGIAADLRAARWLIHETGDVSRWKAWKAATAATFAAEVFTGTPEQQEELRDLVRTEARDVLSAAGYDLADPAELGGAPFSPPPSPEGPAETSARSDPAPQGLSTWQSFARGSGSEVDFLSGEIVLQARLLGIPAPVNEAVQRALAEAAASGEGPGVRSVASVLGVRA